MTFLQKLDGAVSANNSLLCVGLDSDHTKLPPHLVNKPNAIFEFNKSIIDATADLVCAYKPNSAFYEAQGSEGLDQLKQTVDYIHEKYPIIPIILDAKRADIGSTNIGYVDHIFGYLGMDAVTLHPYLGREALEPFLSLEDKGLIILCRTSNPGAGEFQDMEIVGKPLYEHVAEKVKDEWNNKKNCLLVVGATYPEEMKRIRALVGPDMVFLVPGVGAQGGDVRSVLENGLGANQRGLIINSSRGVIFASSGEDFAETARREAIALRDEINKHRGI